MSLFDDTNLPHEVVIHPEIEDRDSYGNVIRRPADTGQTVRCRLQVLSSGRDPSSDARIGTNRAFRFSAKEAPIGRWSKVLWDGLELFVLAGPYRHDTGSRVTHRITATLQVLE